jgi:ribosomal protein S12 methylthiotransferase accessory factor YcaO
MGQLSSFQYTRQLLLKQTYDRASTALCMLGCLELEELTSGQRLGIAIWQALYRDAHIEQIRTYGRGITDLEARTGAVMEAVEDYSTQYVPENVAHASYVELQQCAKVIHPRQLVQTVDYAEDVPISNECVWVPADYALLLQKPLERSTVPIRHSNGLAAGQTLGDAIYHGLCELIERDSWTLAWLRIITRPHLHTVARQLQNIPAMHDGDAEGREEDLPQVIDPATMPFQARQFLNRFHTAGVSVEVYDITSDSGIATTLAIAREMNVADTNRVWIGRATNLSAELALIGAISECAQSRCVSERLGKSPPPYSFAKSFLPLQRQLPKRFEAIVSYQPKDYSDAIQLLLQRIQGVGLQQVVAVDVTHPAIGIPVIKMIVPGIEQWAMFNFDPAHCLLGKRGKAVLAIPVESPIQGADQQWKQS